MSEHQHRIAGVLPSAEALEGVIGALEAAGFERSEFGVLANRDALAGGDDSKALAENPRTHTDADTYPEAEGAVAGGLIAGLTYAAAAVAGGVVLLAGGGLAIGIAAVLGAGGAGGLVGALVARGFQADHAALIDDQIARGGVVLWIQPRDGAQAGAAIAALKAAGADTIVTQPET